uniref:NADH dehydrogenase subunit 1 n=1 Tax=Mactra cumingii TaxID=1131944 RepID=UPI00286CDCD2|nr:NADH dehydrogenase subunit 1 [Mactra cumingii]WLS55697.1 NADH dehydrogenase subunit 1 [Mactra cumingii]
MLLHFLISSIVVMLLMMIGVAFFIVIERKGLGMVQLRQGPNKVSVKGILQAVADGVKLFKKEVSFPVCLSHFTFALGPVICFFCAYSLYLVFPNSFGNNRFELGVLFFLCISSFSVYGVFLVGWLCDSRYAFLGAMRAIAQSISYEVFLSTVLFTSFLFVGSYDVFQGRSNEFLTGILSIGLLMLWFIAALAETNRAPFDFVEGESELVAGYMVEYGGGGFALLALAEYSNIMFMSMMTGVMFFNSGMSLFMFGDVLFSVWVVFVSYLFVLVRGTMPRYRYDLLMDLCWKVLLPLSLSMFVLGALVCC